MVSAFIFTMKLNIVTPVKATLPLPKDYRNEAENEEGFAIDAICLNYCDRSDECQKHYNNTTVHEDAQP